MRYIIILVGLLSGCASWFHTPEDVAQLEANRQANPYELPEGCQMDGVSMVCTHIADADCTKVEEGVYFCGKGMEKFIPKSP